MGGQRHRCLHASCNSMHRYGGARSDGAPQEDERRAETSYLRIQGPSVQGFLLFMAENKSDISCQNSMKICHLETLMRESPRSPALLARFISEAEAHHSYPGVSVLGYFLRQQKRGRVDGNSHRKKKTPRRGFLVFSSRGPRDEPRSQARFFSSGGSSEFSYCATCLWSEESRQKLQWSERSEFGVQ